MDPFWQILKGIYWRRLLFFFAVSFSSSILASKDLLLVKDTSPAKTLAEGYPTLILTFEDTVDITHTTQATLELRYCKVCFRAID